MTGGGHRVVRAVASLIAGLVIGAAVTLFSTRPWRADPGVDTWTFRPPTGGVSVELGPEWQVIDVDPEQSSVFAAQDPEHTRVLNVTGSLIPAGGRFIEILAAGLDLEAVIDQRVLDESRTMLRYRENGFDNLYVARTWSCGTLVTALVTPPLEAGQVDEVLAITDGIRPEGEILLPGPAPSAEGMHRLEAGGVSLAVPDSYQIDPSGDHCLLTTDGEGRSFDVTFTPVLEVDQAIEVLRGGYGGEDEVGEVTETAAGLSRVIIDGATSGVVYFIDAEVGVFMVRHLDPSAAGGIITDLDSLDQVAATLVHSGADEG